MKALKSIKLVTPAFGVKLFLASFAVLWIVNVLAGKAARMLDITEAPDWAVFGVAMLHYAAYAGISLLTLLAFWRLAVWAFRWAVVILATEETEIELQPEKPARTEQQGMIDIGIKTLSEILSEIETNRKAALSRANDLDYQCQELAFLIKAFVRKGDKKLREAAALKQAMLAIANRDVLSPFEFGEAVGAIPDQHLRAMCQVQIDDEDYWLTVHRKTGEYSTVLNTWGQNYIDYGRDLAEQVGGFIVTIAGIRELQSYAAAAPALMTAQRHLLDLAPLLAQKEEQWQVFMDGTGGRPQMTGRSRAQTQHRVAVGAQSVLGDVEARAGQK